jgi:hypothetical protein
MVGKKGKETGLLECASVPVTRHLFDVVCMLKFHAKSNVRTPTVKDDNEGMDIQISKSGPETNAENNGN